MSRSYVCDVCGVSSDNPKTIERRYNMPGQETKLDICSNCNSIIHGKINLLINKLLIEMTSKKKKGN